jgi:hypothetical protein
MRFLSHIPRLQINQSPVKMMRWLLIKGMRTWVNQHRVTGVMKVSGALLSDARLAKRALAHKCTISGPQYLPNGSCVGDGSNLLSIMKTGMGAKHIEPQDRICIPPPPLFLSLSRRLVSFSNYSIPSLPPLQHIQLRSSDPHSTVIRDLGLQSGG